MAAEERQAAQASGMRRAAPLSTVRLQRTAVEWQDEAVGLGRTARGLHRDEEHVVVEARKAIWQLVAPILEAAGPGRVEVGQGGVGNGHVDAAALRRDDAREDVARECIAWREAQRVAAVRDNPGRTHGDLYLERRNGMRDPGDRYGEDRHQRANERRRDDEFVDGAHTAASVLRMMLKDVGARIYCARGIDARIYCARG